MSKAKDGDTVKVHYTGKLDDGTVFDSSEKREPLSFKIGTNSVIPGFEKEVVGMEVGDSKTFTIAPDDAYGHRRDDLVIEVGKSNFPENVTPEIGQQYRVQQADGRDVSVTVVDIKSETVTLDANHPLAGKSLIFDIELVEVA